MNKIISIFINFFFISLINSLSLVDYSEYLNIDSEEIVNQKIYFFVHSKKFNGYVSPCTSFQNSNDDTGIFGYNCYETNVIAPKVIEFLNQQYKCLSVDTHNDLAMYYDCKIINYYDEDNDEDENNVKVFIPRNIKTVTNLNDGEISNSSCDTFSVTDDNNLMAMNCYEEFVTSPKEIIYNHMKYECRSVNASEDFSVFSNCKSEVADESYSDVSLAKWIQHSEGDRNFPKDAVRGGHDIDDAALFVIRKQSSYSGTMYGKYAKRGGRQNGYVTDSYSEFGVSNFELLTAERYSWCKNNPFKSYDNSIPVCRARYVSNNEELIIPGTLVGSGKCRIGYGLQAHIIKASDVEVLVFGIC